MGASAPIYPRGVETISGWLEILDGIGFERAKGRGVVEQGGPMRWSVCVFAAGEGRPRPWASFADLTIVPLDEDLTSAATQSCDLAIAYLPPGDADSLDAFVRAVASRRSLLVVLNEHRPERVVRFLDLGAYDVVPDCISTEELFARGRSIIFRGSPLRVGGKSRPVADNRCVPQGQAATTNLRHSESKLFEYLRRHSDRAVPQSELIANVFGGVHAPDTSLVRVHVAALRRYLGAYSHGLRTVRARGYILDSTVFPPNKVL